MRISIREPLSDGALTAGNIIRSTCGLNGTNVEEDIGALIEKVTRLIEVYSNLVFMYINKK